MPTRNKYILDELDRVNSELSLAHQKIEDKEEIFSQVIGSISEVVYIYEFSNNGTPINKFISSGIEKLTGYSHVNFANDWTFWPNIILMEDQPIAREQSKKLYNGEDSEAEYRILAKNGDITWIKDSAVIKEYPGSRSVYGTFTNITKYKEDEEIKNTLIKKLSRHRRRFTQLLNGCVSAVLMIEEDLCVSFANNKAKTLLNLKQDIEFPFQSVINLKEALSEKVQEEKIDDIVNLTVQAFEERSSTFFPTIVTVRNEKYSFPHLFVIRYIPAVNGVYKPIVRLGIFDVCRMNDFINLMDKEELESDCAKREST